MLQKTAPSGIYPGILLLVFPFLFLPFTFDEELTLRYLGLAILLIPAAIFALSQKSIDKAVLKHPVTIAYGAYIGITLFTVVRSVNPGDGLYEWSKQALMFMLYMLFAFLFRSQPNSTGRIARMMTFSVLLFCLFALIQLVPVAIQSLQTDTPFTVSDKVFSTLSNKNFFAETILIGLPFIICFYLNAAGWLRTISLITFMLTLFFIAIVQSLSAYIGLTFGVIVVAIIHFFSKRKNNQSENLQRPALRMVTGAVVFIMLIAGTTFIFRDKINFRQMQIKMNAIGVYIAHPGKIFKVSDRINNNSVYDRLFLARGSVKMFQEHPITGIGMANWRIYFPKYGLFGSEYWALGKLRYEHPHNEYLFILAQSGLAGLLTWLAILFFALRAAASLLKNETTRIIALTFIMALTGFIITSCFGYPKERFFSMAYIAVILALITSMTGRDTAISAKEIPMKFFTIALLVITIPLVYIHFLRYKGEVFLNTGLAMQKNQDFGRMAAAVKKAKSPFFVLDNTSTPLDWYEGLALYYQNNHQAAFPLYQSAALQNPYHMQVLNDLGALYEEQKNHVEAISLFNRVFAINPDFANAKLNMIAVHFNMGNIEKAYEMMRVYPYRFNDKWRGDMKIILMNKAQKYLETTKDSSLANYLNKQLQHNPNYLLNEYTKADRGGRTFEEEIKAMP